MARDSKKINVEAGDSTFIGQVVGTRSGGSGSSKWLMVILTAVTPWDNAELDKSPATVQPGEEVIWFTPKGRQYDEMVDGAIVEISRSGRAYEISTPKGETKVPDKLVPASTAVEGDALVRRIAGAYDVARKAAIWYNGSTDKLAHSMPGGTAGVDGRSLDVLALKLTGREVSSLAISLMIGESRGEIVIPPFGGEEN